MQKQMLTKNIASLTQAINDLPSIYYQSCTSGEQCLVSYSHTRNILVFTKLVSQLQIFNKENGGWDGSSFPTGWMLNFAQNLDSKRRKGTPCQ